MDLGYLVDESAFNRIFSDDRPVKRIAVKSESRTTGHVVLTVDCGTDQAKADSVLQKVMDRTNTQLFHVYQSIER